MCAGNLSLTSYCIYSFQSLVKTNSSYKRSKESRTAIEAALLFQSRRLVAGRHYSQGRDGRCNVESGMSSSVCEIVFKVLCCLVESKQTEHLELDKEGNDL